MAEAAAIWDMSKSLRTFKASDPGAFKIEFHTKLGNTWVMYFRSIESIDGQIIAVSRYGDRVRLA